MNIKKIIMAGAFCFSFVFVFAIPLSADKKEQLDIVQNSQKIRKKGMLPLFFADAETGLPVSDVHVTLYSDDTESYFVSDKNGFISIPKLEDGEFKIKYNANGYIQEEGLINVKAGFIANYRFIISKILLDTQIRIVLQWGEQPADLDLHLEKDGGYHISYRNMLVSEDGSANLDRDDTDSYGPETITLNAIERGVPYYVYVVDYTNRNNAISQKLSQSNAFVKIYVGEELELSTYISEGISGNRWNVCTIKDGNITLNGTVVTNY